MLEKEGGEGRGLGEGLRGFVHMGRCPQGFLRAPRRVPSHSVSLLRLPRAAPHCLLFRLCILIIDMFFDFSFFPSRVSFALFFLPVLFLASLKCLIHGFIKRFFSVPHSIFYLFLSLLYHHIILIQWLLRDVFCTFYAKVLHVDQGTQVIINHANLLSLYLCREN